MLECVVNVSEGRDAGRARRARGGRRRRPARPARGSRTTTAPCSPPSARTRPAASPGWPSSASTSRAHDGVHPRLGAVDVVPFVALDGIDRWPTPPPPGTPSPSWAGDELGLPVPSATAATGPTLPEVRRRAFAGPRARRRAAPAPPDRRRGGGGRPGRRWWPTTSGWPSPTWPWPGGWPRRCGATAIRALGLAVGDRVQVSMNLVEPEPGGPGGGLRPGGGRGAAWPAPSWWACSRRRSWTAVAPDPVGGAGPGRGPDDRGPPGR